MSPYNFYRSLLIGAVTVISMMSEVQADARPTAVDYGFFIEFRDNAPRRHTEFNHGHRYDAPRNVISGYRSRFGSQHETYVCQDEHEHRHEHKHHRHRKHHQQRQHAPRFRHDGPARIVDIDVNVNQRPIIYRSRW